MTYIIFSKVRKFGEDRLNQTVFEIFSKNPRGRGGGILAPVQIGLKGSKFPFKVAQQRKIDLFLCLFIDRVLSKCSNKLSQKVKLITSNSKLTT